MIMPTFCDSCNCMTKTIDGLCGKCKAGKAAEAMQNEPQLSAEMEIVTKFRQFLADWDYAHITRKVPVEESRKMCDEFAITLATALEEQRAEYEKKVNDLMTTRLMADRGVDTEYLHKSDVLALLNRKDTNE